MATTDRSSSTDLSQAHMGLAEAGHALMDLEEDLAGEGRVDVERVQSAERALLAALGQVRKLKRRRSR